MIVISHDVVWGIAQPLYVYAPYTMYPFIWICSHAALSFRGSFLSQKFLVHPFKLRQESWGFVVGLFTRFPSRPKGILSNT